MYILVRMKVWNSNSYPYWPPPHLALLLEDEVRLLQLQPLVLGDLQVVELEEGEVDGAQEVPHLALRSPSEVR